MHTASAILVPIRFFLCIGQFILLVFLIISYENYVYAGMDLNTAIVGTSDYSSIRSR